jgi:hypothetical protein
MACFFLFLWLACLLACTLRWFGGGNPVSCRGEACGLLRPTGSTSVDRNSFLALTVGIFGAILFFGYPLGDLDDVRHLLETDNEADFRYLAAGFTMACLSPRSAARQTPLPLQGASWAISVLGSASSRLLFAKLVRWM